MQASFIYAGAILAFIIIVCAVAGRRFRIIPGALAVLFSGFAVSICIGFINVYANQMFVGVSGIFAVGVTLLTVVLAIFMYKCTKLSFALLGSEKVYDQYRGFVLENNSLEEQPAEPQEAVKEEKVIEPQKQRYDGKHGLIKKALKLSGLSKSEAVYDAIYSNKDTSVDFGAKANHFTFQQKLRRAKPIVRARYKEIKKYFEQLGFKANTTKTAETFIYKNTKFALLTTAGQTGLKIYYKLSPADYENSPIPVKDVSDKKKYEKTPLLFVVKSDLAVRRAKALMEDIKNSL